jgi:hypothetical protein
MSTVFLCMCMETGFVLESRKMEEKEEKKKEMSNTSLLALTFHVLILSLVYI